MNDAPLVVAINNRSKAKLINSYSKKLYPLRICIIANEAHVASWVLNPAVALLEIIQILSRYGFLLLSHDL